MIRRITVYMLVLLLTVYLFFMYNDAVIPGILVLELLYPIVSLAYLSLVSKKISGTVFYAPSMGEKNQSMEVKLHVSSEFGFGHVRVRIHMSQKSNFADKKIRRRMMVTVANKNEETFRYTVSSPYCGNLEVCMEYIDIYDFLGLFYKRKRAGDKKHIGIMPKYQLMPLEITRRTREFVADADDHSLEKSGDDPTEIYQIREYRPMDSVHDIHWKLTAKEDQLMVKEHALPLGCVVLVWLDLTSGDRTGKEQDRLLEQMASLSLTLIEEKCIHMAAWFEEKNQRVVKRKIDSEEAVYAMIWQLLVQESCKDKELSEIFYDDAFRGEQFSSRIIIKSDGTITVNGQEQEFLQI